MDKWEKLLAKQAALKKMLLERGLKTTEGVILYPDGKVRDEMWEHEY